MCVRYRVLSASFEVVLCQQGLAIRPGPGSGAP